jgi:hypothetical protein
MNRIAVLIAAALGSAPAFAEIAEPAGLTPALRAPQGAPALVLAARGAQVYVCKPKAGDPYAFQWTFVAPEASLYDGGKLVGRHGKGPSWEGLDQSRVTGKVVKGQDGGAGNIPWLLLEGTAAPNPGMLAGVTYVQRVNTKGGVEPSGGCDAAHDGQQARIDYTADYYFYKASDKR